MSGTATRTPGAEAPAMATPALDAVVERARRRMRWNRALATAGPAVLAAAAATGLWLLAGRVALLPGVDLWVAVGAATLAIVAIAVAAAVRIPDVYAAWAADRWLDTDDLYSTAVELAPAPRGPVDRAQVARAEESAAGFRGFPDGPRLPGRMLGTAAVAVLAAAVLGLAPNPQDDVRAQHAAEQAAIDASADDLRARADEAAAAGDEQLAAELEAVAEELRGAETPEEALDALDRARAALAERLEDDLASQRTALTGLARELGREPLAAGDTVREQLDSLAGDLSEGRLGAEEQAALADRLRELAEALAAGQPELAGALRDAAGALEAGDPAAAAGAVAAASGAVGDALQGLAGQQRLADAAGALDAAADTVRAAQQGQGQSQGPGQSQSQSQSQGQGQGQGGAGGGGGGGNPTGSQGQGGANTGNGVGNAGAHGDLDLQTVYDPPAGIGTDGDDLHLGGRDSGQGEESTVGSGRGEGIGNEALVPYLDVLADYLERASRTIERAGYPIELRTLVRDYFDRLSVPE